MHLPQLLVADRALAAALIFALTYAVLAFGSLRPLRLDRPGATLVGATAMVASGVLTPQEAVAAIDFHTLALLFGMMIVVAHLRLAGFFRLLAGLVLERAGSPRRLLVLITWLSGLLSALFVNDTVCVLLTPLVLETTLALGLPPVPYLLAVAMGANVGSVATIVGNPQNMMVASFSGIPYTRFAAVLAPVALAGLALASWLLDRAYGRALAPRPVTRPTAERPRLHRDLLVKTLVVSALLLGALLLGATPSLAALVAASALLVTRRIKPIRVYAQVDWALLVMFAGLFVVVEGVERAGLAARWLALVAPAHREALPALVGATALLSNLVSNVPAVLLLKAWVLRLASPERAWLALAMASTLAGNLTIVASVANLIVVEQARPHARIGFWTYARVGVPLTLVTLAAGTAWLALVTR